MPKNTFFRLPEEKRLRLTEAAWQEFIRTSCTDGSINRIVQTAHIPRGSFYQYFTGKEDLFSFLMRDLHAAFWQELYHALESHGGALSAALPALFDDWFLRKSVLPLPAYRMWQLLLKNPALDWQQFVFPSSAPTLPHRVRTLLAGSPAAPGYGEQGETAGILAIGTFAGICKQCLFSPELAYLRRQELLRAIQVLFRPPAAVLAERA